MSTPLISRVQFEKTSGLKSAPSPHAVGDGWQDAMNAGTTIPGTLASCRTGMRPAIFDEIAVYTGNDIIACFGFPAAVADFIVYQDADGNVVAGRNPQ